MTPIEEIELIKDFERYFEYHSDGYLIRKKSLPGSGPSGSIVKSHPNKKTGHSTIGFKKKNYYVHRVIFAIVNGYFPDQVDHIDRNPLNNKIENLRECTALQNMWNRTRNKDGNIKGLDFHGATNRWRGRIKVSGAVHFFQSKDKEKVILWLAESRSKLHGEFACA